MASGFPRSPKILKGAIVSFDAPFLIPIPNIIVFQYNPETLSRSLTPFEPPDDDQGQSDSQGTAQPYDPEESFTLEAIFDATDHLESPETHPIAVATGVAAQVSALEMLLYPEGEESLLGDLVGAVSAALSGGANPAAEAVVPRTVPVTLFIWGPGRMVPVRITSFTVEEQAFSTLLYPIRVKASIGMTILTPSAFPRENRNAAQEIAVFCYNFTRGQKELLAMANIANSVESILSMLPL